MPDDNQETVHIDLASCKVLEDKYVCDLHKHKLLSRELGTIRTDNEEIDVDLAPYLSQDIGISFPIFPGGPSVSFDIGTDFPFTVLPISKKLIRNLGDPWSLIWGEDRQ